MHGSDRRAAINVTDAQCGIDEGTTCRAASPTPGPTGHNDAGDVDHPGPWSSMAEPKAEKLREFLKELVSLEEIVGYVAGLEKEKSGSVDDVMKTLADPHWWGIPAGEGSQSFKRYLVVRSKGVGVLDMKHFFAAMVEAYGGFKWRQMTGLPLPGSEARALFLGLMVEAVQCAQRSPSCFSAEDLVSNRLGARLGAGLKWTLGSRRSGGLHQEIESFLAGLQPIPASEVKAIRVQSSGRVTLEAISAFLRGVLSYGMGLP